MKTLLTLASLVLLLVQARSETARVPEEYPTIQKAIDSAANGDTIIVRPGTYFENIDFMGKAITVKSERGADRTIIDGSYADSVVTFTSGESADSVLDGFTLTNGREVSGGGIYCELSSPTITNNTIYWNKADYGGGIYCGGLSSPEIKNNLITWNRVDSHGGGIYCDDSSPTILGNTLSANKANDGYGGGLYFLSSPFSIVTENTIIGNGACNGGGIFFDFSAPPISNNTILYNVAGLGGGIYCHYSSPIISANSVEGNIGGAAGGICCQDSNPTIVRNTIGMNEAVLSHGGGIYCHDGSPFISGNLVSENTADEDGGGIYCVYDSSPIITNNVITGNTADKAGGGICCCFDIKPVITNNTITGNSAMEGGGIYCCDSSVDIASTILWDNSASVGSEVWLGDASYPSTLTISFSDVDGGQVSCQVESGSTLNWGSGMIDADPLFVDSANDDYHLTWSSPCRDTGDNTSVTDAFDFEGDPRIVGMTVDMGADEFYYHLYHVGQLVPGGTVDLKVIGYPQAPVTLAWGQTILDPPLSTPHGNLYIWPFVWSGFIGNVQSNGVLSMPVVIPSNWQPGDHAPLQALVGPWGGVWTKLTNLTDVVVE